VFLTAHTHEATFTPVVATSGAWVVEAGNDTYLGRLDMQFDNGAPVTRNWSLLEVDSRFTEDPKVAALVDQARAPFLAADVNMSLSMSNTQMRLTQAIDTVVGQAPLGLDRRQALENRFNDSYTDALRRYSGTQIAITPGFRYDAVIPGTNENYEDPAVVAGQVTVEDAYRFFPVPFTLSTANVSGTRLKQVIEQNLTAVFSTDRFARAGGWFDGYSGVNLQLKLSNPDGRRVTGILMQDSGAILADNDTLSIAGCSRPFDRDGSTTICSYDGFTEVTPLLNPLTQSPWLGVDFLIYALENGLLNTAPPATRITDQSATVFWPESDFYQPL
jgi:2',3'-cyclic-nucleotide 2'-phosphodiesterase (5'-nucleotidase family)